MSDGVRRGRKRLGNRARRRSACIAVTEDERRRIEAACRPERVSVVLRRVVLGWIGSGVGAPAEPLPEVDLVVAHRRDARALGAQIARVGNLLNQLLRRLHSMDAAGVEPAGAFALDDALEIVEGVAERVELARAEFQREAERR